VVLEHGGGVWSLAVLADGRLASGGEDGQIKLWLLDRSETFAEPADGMGEPVVLEHGGGVWSLAVLADGRLASGGSDGQIKLWLDTEPLIGSLCLRAGRNLSGREWAHYLGLRQALAAELP
jgi:WD40 repeat protein